MIAGILPRTKPKQSLGQNFLIDDNIARKIVREMNPSKYDVAVEIGPGRGALTKHLGEAVRHLFAVEIDSRIVNELRATFTSSHVAILHQDFLETDLAALKNQCQQKLRLVGNIPYHLTSPILFKIFEARSFVEDVTMMIQREVALRITAQPGTKQYGILSVFSRFYGTPKILFTVSPHCFYPAPKVTSAVVNVTLHKKIPNDVDEQIFATVVKTSFGKRRKTLRNSLMYLPYDTSTVDTMLGEIDFPLEKRPEQLSLEEFIQLTQQIERFIT